MSDLLRRRALMQAASRGKTMQLLAEYEVTNSTLTIPITGKLENCEVLYVSLDVTTGTNTWIYFSLDTNAGNGTTWLPQGTVHKYDLVVYQNGEKSIDGVTFGPGAASRSSDLNRNVLVEDALTAIRFYSANFTGTVKIFGEV